VQNLQITKYSKQAIWSRKNKKHQDG